MELVSGTHLERLRSSTQGFNEKAPGAQLIDTLTVPNDTPNFA